MEPQPTQTKSRDAFRTISEVAGDLDVPQHVLRFWESKFSQLRPLKRGGGRRYYRPDDINLLRGIRQLLHSDGYTIRGVQKLLKEHGVRYVIGLGRGFGEEMTGEAEAAPAMEEAFVEDTRAVALAGEGAETIAAPLAAAPVVAGLTGEQAQVLREALGELEAARDTLTALAGETPEEPVTRFAGARGTASR